MYIEHLSFKVKNLGNIQSGELAQKPFTVFCGPNNSGKTWAMYSLYSFYKMLEKAHEEPFAEQVSKYGINKLIAQNLHVDFNVPQNQLTDARFDCDLDMEEWQNLASEYDVEKTNVFLMPAERNGLHLFFRELSTRRTALLHHASRKNIDIYALLRDVMRSRYAKPLADYINWLNQITDFLPGTEYHHEVMKLQRDVVGGRYHLNRKTADITFTPYKKRRDIDTKTIELHSTSSAVKSLFGLWFYLEHQAKEGDVLMIDEPEANIHPQNQLLLTHFLARLVNQGINVIISTHSDYIVREVNNLILLNETIVLSEVMSNEKSGLQKNIDKINKGKITYDKNAFLSADKVGMYSFDENTISSMKYTERQGFGVKTFDEVIIRQNETNLELYHGLMEEADDD